jgi:uncharacterized protein
MEHQNDRGWGTVAVIGGGVAGIVAAHLLQKTHRVTLFEQGDYLGGHTHTVTIPDGQDAGTPVDTGFIVFNEATYPHFIGFLAELGVPSRITEMSFSFHCVETGFVYAGNDLNGLFAQRINLLRPRFYRFLFEIGRFCHQAKVDVETQEDLGSLGEYIRQHHFLPFMVDNYLKPMAAAIWSTPTAEVTAFPARAFLLFFRNHGLLDLWNRPAWRTVAGGSSSYVKAFTASFTGTVHLSTKIRRIFRTDGSVQVQFADQHHEAFDQVVLATHADQSLHLLGDPTPEERRLLSPWQYEENNTVLHTDLSVLPPMQRAWSCWNFRREGSIAATHPAYVTYAMNLLQGLTTNKQYLVTLNRPSAYDEKQVIARMVYHHPIYTNTSMATQVSLPNLNGTRNTWFCGSYFGYGFHEDAVRSSYRAVAHLQNFYINPSR